MCAVILFFQAPHAWAAPPSHLRLPALDLAGFNHACSVAVDSNGDIYVANAGNGSIDVFDSSHLKIAAIPNGHGPCGVAVNGEGDVFVAEGETGEVVRYRPDSYPLAASPTYGVAEPIDESGQAKGITIDQRDDRLYVAQGDRIAVFNAVGEPDFVNEVQNLTVSEGAAGKYRLTFQGESTVALPAGADADELQKALEALAAIGVGNVAVTPDGIGLNVTFVGTLAATDVAPLEGDQGELVGGSLSLATLSQGYNGYIGEGELENTIGVAAFSYPSGDRYVYAADSTGSQGDRVAIFGGTAVPVLRLRRDLLGPASGEVFGFGAEGAYLASDPGNEGPGEKCAEENGAQACTAGHLLVYDDAHHAVEEFDASGEYLDRFSAPELADAAPTALAIDRSQASGDGTIYVTSGAGSGSEALAFGPLAPPGRAPLSPPLSRVLKTAALIATDSTGYVYVRVGAEVRVYDPKGVDLQVQFADARSPTKLAVDSMGNVYVADKGKGFEGETEMTYYAPSEYPPVTGTSYSRHEPALVTEAELEGGPETLGIDPSNDRLLAIDSLGLQILELDSVSHGSKILRLIHPARPLNVHPSTIAAYGANGNIYVGERPGAVAILASDGKALARINGAGSPTGKFGTNPVFAVDQSNGHILELDEGSAALREFDASGAFVAESSELNTAGFNDVSVDSSCALHRDGAGKSKPLDETTTPTCKQLYPANGTVDVVTSGAVTSQHPFNVNAFGPLEYGGPPFVNTGEANEIGGGEATLTGTVDPRGVELTKCQFEYTTVEDFEQDGFAGATATSCVPSIAAIGSGSGAVPVHARITGLTSGESYNFRLSTASKYGASEGNVGIFGPPLLTEMSPLPVLYTEAILRADVDPRGLSTAYYFEYGEKEGEYTNSTPVQVLGGDAGNTSVEAVLTDLSEGVRYHFRAVAENEAGAVTGLDQAFSTQVRSGSSGCGNGEYRTGLSANLPDCRAYELVTPADTNGLSPGAAPLLTTGSTEAGFNNWLATPTGSASGERVSYYTQGTLPGFDGNGFSDGYRAERGAGQHPQGGWSSTLFAPTYRESAADFFHAPSQQSVGPDQLYSFWVVVPGQELDGTLESGSYLSTPGEVGGSACNPVPQQSDFELVGCGSLGRDASAESRYVSAGGDHVIFVSKARLEAEAAPVGTMSVYDRSVGSNVARVISLKPGESPFGAGQDARYLGSTEDGSSVAFSVGGSLFLRRNDAETVAVADGPATFAGISDDGARVFYAKTTNGSLPASLFTCDVAAGACLGPEPTGLTQIASEATFAGISPDGTTAFYSSADHKLYSWSAETHAATFIAQLDSSDFENKGFAGISGMNLAAWTAAINPGPGIGRALAPVRFTSDGSVALFQSHARLTAYDNGGKGEVYRYDGSAPEGSRIICVSCDPGEAPASADALLEDTGTATGVRHNTMIANLFSGGAKVFFQSRDRLLPEDANDAEDVYEWTAQGAGEPVCDRAGGCLALISSGQGENDSFLFGMSSDGRDVFIRTLEKLVEADVPGSPSIYDVRVEGGIPGPSAKQICTGDACQGERAPSPALSSAATTGPGESNPPKRPGACPKSRHRVKGRCVKRHQKTRDRHRAHHGRRSGR